MKKIFILATLLLTTFSGFAQTEDVTGPTTIQKNHNLLSGLYTPNEGFGLKGGVNFNTLRGSDKDNLGTINELTSFHAGVFAQFAFNDFFSLQPEVLYSRKGFERNDSTFRYDYLEVPVLAVFNVTENISFHLGPQASIMVSAKEEDKEIDLEPFNTFDYGVAAGAEAHISRFRLGARYNLGFADLRNQNEAGQHINEDIKHGTLQLYVGFSF
ncbi:porin family protein [Pontibacter vulgaris]|uniref:porin family protein n=1 Tax=Pontibacter vulgaris TaxID=2905679 RepID=UPI001FA79C16|nr:porin family protein [Pontibacter vulgaris]